MGSKKANETSGRFSFRYERTNERKEKMRRKNKLLVCNTGLGGGALESQYIYQASKLRVPVVCFIELVQTDLQAVWLEQNSPYTQFFQKSAKKESDVTKVKTARVLLY